MQSQRNKVKMPLLLYSLFLVIAILATFNYFLSTGLPTQQILTENFENDRNLKNQEESVVSEEEQSKRIKTCLYFWGERHQDSPSDINKDANGCPREIPEMLYDQFTMGRTIGVEYWYQCQTGPQYDAKHVYTKESIDNLIERIRRREENYYGHTDTFLYRALDDFPIRNKSVVIMGSQRPIYESVCLVFGGASCQTIDFQPITIEHPDSRLGAITIAEYDRNPISFDVAFSISSFEHDGLGRYGDPLRPNGDLEMMKKMKCIVKPNGLLFLSVPIAKDKIVWNMHRVYGQIRLPRLLQFWTLLGVYGDAEMIRRYTGCDAGREGDYQPVFVLQNKNQPDSDWNIRFLSQYIDNRDGYDDFDEQKSCFT
jgi:hypothetical protein